jgi:hypothetical protein
MLAIPMVLGLAAGGARSAAAWRVPPATVCVFMAHHAIVPWAQRAWDGKPSPPGYAPRRIVWGLSGLVGAAVFFFAAWIATPPETRSVFLAIAAAAALLAGVYAAASMLGHARSIVPEILGLAGVSLTGPMMAAAAGRPLDRSLFGSAILGLAYCLSSVAFVRAYDRLRKNKLAAIRACVLAHAAIAAALVGAAASGALPAWWWIGFVPVTIRTASGLAAPARNLRQLGLREVWVALSFTLGSGAALYYADFSANRYQTGPANASATAVSTPGSPISSLRISRSTATAMTTIGRRASTASPGMPSGTRNGPRRSGSDRLSFKREANSSPSAAV